MPPPTKMSAVTMSPIPKPAIRGASGETAVPKTAQSRKIVRIASTAIAIGIVTPAPSAGVPGDRRDDRTGADVEEHERAGGFGEQGTGMPGHGDLLPLWSRLFCIRGRLPPGRGHEGPHPHGPAGATRDPVR